MHDEQIQPLMQQVCDICKQHGIEFTASFMVGTDNFRMWAEVRGDQSPLTRWLGQ